MLRALVLVARCVFNDSVLYLSIPLIDSRSMYHTTASCALDLILPSFHTFWGLYASDLRP